MLVEAQRRAPLDVAQILEDETDDMVADVLEQLGEIKPVGGTFRAHEALGVATLALAEGNNSAKQIVVIATQYEGLTYATMNEFYRLQERALSVRLSGVWRTHVLRGWLVGWEAAYTLPASILLPARVSWSATPRIASSGLTAGSGGIYKTVADGAGGAAYGKLMADSEITGQNDGAVDPLLLADLFDHSAQLGLHVSPRPIQRLGESKTAQRAARSPNSCS